MIVTILVFTVSTIGILSYTGTTNYVRKDIDHLSEQILKQANLNLNRYYSEYELAFLMLGNSTDVRDWMRLSSGDVTSELIKSYTRIKDNYLNRMFLQYPEVLSVTLYKPGGREQHFLNKYALPLSYSIKDEPYLAETGSFEKVKYMTGISEHYMNSDNRSMSLPVLTLFKPFYNGYLQMEVSLNPSQSIMDQIHIVDSGVSAVMHESGTIVHHSDPSRIMEQMEPRIVEAVARSEAGSYYDSTGDDLVVFQTIPVTGWKIVAILPYEQIAHSIYDTRNVTIAIAIGALAISVALTYFAASSITRRLIALRKTMKTMQVREDFAIRAEVEGTDEVADLSLSFNKLLGHLEQSVHDYAEMKALQHRAVISALQSQINSHFLYNTLETINSMTVIAKQPHIGKVAVSLSRMLRYTSDFKHVQVRLGEELALLDSYLQIIKARFKDEVACEVDVPMELMPAMCCKALLQPLVENSIKHVREATGQAVRLKISGEIVGENALKLTVRDDGPGFKPEVLARLRLEQAASGAKDYPFAQVGLSNMIYRLQSFYDGEALVVFDNHPEGGAVVEITLPRAIDQDEQ
jgi:two-component system sensor histidine kinase YesM